MTWMQIIQWILLIWIVSVFLHSILDIFKLDKHDNIITGFLFISAGFIWIASLVWRFDVNRLFFPYFPQSVIGLLLAVYGIKMIWKKPVGSIIACVVIVMVLGILYVKAPSLEINESRFLSRYFPFLSSTAIWNKQSNDMPAESKQTEKETNRDLLYGKASDEYLDLISDLNNLTLKTDQIDGLFVVQPGSSVEDRGNHQYKINHQQGKTSLTIRNQLKLLRIFKDIGNTEGVLDGSFNMVVFESDAGNIKLDLKGSINSFQSNLDMGNLDLNLYTAIPSIKIKVEVGNITIHVAKGIRINSDSVKTNIGQLKIEQSEDDSKGTINLEAETNIGNITVIADL